MSVDYSNKVDSRFSNLHPNPCSAQAGMDSTHERNAPKLNIMNMTRPVDIIIHTVSAGLMSEGSVMIPRQNTEI